METIKEAKIYLRKNFEQGCKCPACGQFVKEYKRKITSSMAYALIVAYRKQGVENPFHLETLLNEQGTAASIRGDAPKLRLWGLIDYGDCEPKEDMNPRNGWYFITKFGEQFIKGFVKVRKYVHVYNNKTIQIEDNEPLVSIVDCLGQKFNYDELMKGN